MSGSLTRADKLLCATYAGIALVALFATWSHNLAFFQQPDNGGLPSFIAAAYANPAAASISNDILFYLLAGWLFMVVEARRLGIKHVWVYLALSGLIAISVMFPLFLITRQAALARRRARP
ncbi:MAG: DUF2834 domain-containing protein [Anaerolineales bacterium]|nr:DUF2834 domain-containing protein [Anaerolineales bacterium]